ncbi:MAG: hypothetical protein LBR68_00015 [Lachnoclostridium sp.]|jgi:hypothetical protein|nr:hypothetical protein [Lachnoclostridium sp.]
MNTVKNQTMTIADIRKEQESRLSNLFKTLGIFFAFSTEQFNSQKKEGVTYVSAGSGMIIPKDKVEDFKKGFSLMNKEINQLYEKFIPMDDYILCELYNHEAFYTGDLEDSFEAIILHYPDCTMEDVERVFYKKRKG